MIGLDFDESESKLFNLFYKNNSNFSISYCTALPLSFAILNQKICYVFKLRNGELNAVYSKHKEQEDSDLHKKISKFVRESNGKINGLPIKHNKLFLLYAQNKNIELKRDIEPIYHFDF